jgi:hypothetical protein
MPPPGPPAPPGAAKAPPQGPVKAPPAGSAPKAPPSGPGGAQLGAAYPASVSPTYTAPVVGWGYDGFQSTPQAAPSVDPSFFYRVAEQRAAPGWPISGRPPNMTLLSSDPPYSMGSFEYPHPHRGGYDRAPFPHHYHHGPIYGPEFGPRLYEERAPLTPLTHLAPHLYEQPRLPLYQPPFVQPPPLQTFPRAFHEPLPPAPPPPFYGPPPAYYGPPPPEPFYPPSSRRPPRPIDVVIEVVDRRGSRSMPRRSPSSSESSHTSDYDQRPSPTHRRPSLVRFREGSSSPAFRAGRHRSRSASWTY